MLQDIFTARGLENAAIAFGLVAVMALLLWPRRPDMFISYRREGGSALARALECGLTSSGLRVFLDVSSLKAGPFPDELARRVASTPNFLLILSPNALDRCNEADDWVRAEVTRAFAANRRIIRLDVPPFTVPNALPEPLTGLKDLQRYVYEHEKFATAISDIRRSIAPYLWRKRFYRASEIIGSISVIALLLLAAIYTNPEIYFALAEPREAWKRVGIRDSQGPIAATWKDIVWLPGQQKGWLAGVAAGEGGWPTATVPLGRGILLYTDNIHDSWTDVTDSVAVELRSSISQRLTQPVRIGPITALQQVPSDFFEEPQPDKKYHFIASTYTGIYRLSYKEGTFLADRQVWKRFDPLSDDLVFFDGLGFISHSLYAIGWRGILYWRSDQQNWRQEFSTGNRFPITSVTTLGTTDIPGVWAAGRARKDSLGGEGSSSHGAIYTLKNIGEGKWEQIPSPSGIFGSRQNLHAIKALDPNTLVAVGMDGYVTRVTRNSEAAQEWTWERVRLPGVPNHLNAIDLQEFDALWVAGDGGTILKASDNGRCWRTIQRVAPTAPNSNDNGLFRIRFFGPESGWIVGENVVLQYERAPPILGFLRSLPFPPPKLCENVKS